MVKSRGALTGPPRRRRAVIEQNALFRPQTIVIEDRASGTQLIQDLIGDGLSHVARFSPDGDKIMRLHAQSAVIENGFVFVPEEAPWLADYLAELTAFPAGRHDDQVDSTAQFLAWTKRRAQSSAEAWIEFYRMPWGPTRDKPEPMVRLLAPQGTSHVQVAPSGRQYVVRDGSVEVAEEDAPPLLRAGFRRD
jgi:predicted phage terminase large subunit-like protein